MPRSLPACLLSLSLSLSPCPPFSGVGGLYKTNIQPGSAVQRTTHMMTGISYEIRIVDPLKILQSFYLTLFLLHNVLPSVETAPHDPSFRSSSAGLRAVSKPSTWNIFHLNESQLDSFARVLWLEYTYHPFCSNFITAFIYFCSMECECRHIRTGECKFCGLDNLHIICMSYDVSSLQIYL